MLHARAPAPSRATPPRRASSTRAAPPLPAPACVGATSGPAAGDAAGRAAVPAPSSVKASVQLVPKRGASAALLRGAAASQHAGDGDAVSRFLLKCRLAWNLFFPPAGEAGSAAPAPALSPKDLGKQRLQMILVADRCGLSPNSLVEMKRNTLAALADCMELQELQDANLRFTMTREGGTTYSMAVPILRGDPYADDGSVVGQSGAAAATDAHSSEAGDSYDEYDAVHEGSDELGAAARADAATHEYASAWPVGGHHGGKLDAAAAAAAGGAVHTSTDNRAASKLGEAQLAYEEEDSDCSDSDGAPLTPPSPAAAADAEQRPASVGRGSGDEQGVLRQQLRALLVDELLQDVDALAAQAAPARGAACVADVTEGVSAVAAAAAAIAALGGSEQTHTGSSDTPVLAPRPVAHGTNGAAAKETSPLTAAAGAAAAQLTGNVDDCLPQ